MAVTAALNVVFTTRKRRLFVTLHTIVHLSCVEMSSEKKSWGMLGDVLCAGVENKLSKRGFGGTLAS